MLKKKLFISILLSVLLASSGLFSSIKAFTNCNSCRNKSILRINDFTKGDSGVDENTGGDDNIVDDERTDVDENTGGDDSIGDDENTGVDENTGGDDNIGDDENTGGDDNIGDDENTSDDEGPDVDNNNDNEKCARNMEKVSIESAFAMCQITTGIRKSLQIIALYSRLQRRLQNLFSIMRRAPVCTGNGYMPDEFPNDHSLTGNIENMKNISDQMKDIRDELRKISLDCDNCKDDAALNNALAEINALLSTYNTLKSDFNDEMSNAENRYSAFLRRLDQVVRRHGVSVREIMRECGVNRRIARRMARARRRVLRAINVLRNYKDNFDKKKNDIDFGTHTCVKAKPSDRIPASSCLNLNI